MVLPNKFKIVFKTISALLAGIFLFNQVAWACDPIDAALERQYKDQSQTFAPDYLQNQQSAVESIVSQKQAAEDYINPLSIQAAAFISQEPVTIDLQGPAGGGSEPGVASAPAESMVSQAQPEIQEDPAALIVTTSGGDKIGYKSGAIDFIERADGVILKNLTLDENNNLLGAEITYPDGTARTVAGGRVINAIQPDGAVLNYNNEELLSSVVYPDGRTTYCSYVKDGGNNILETILTDADKVSRYDSYGRLTKVEFDTGKIIDYESGVISKITEPDGGVFTFYMETNSDMTITSSIDQYRAANGDIYRYNKDENGRLSSISAEKDGYLAAYNKEGALINVTKNGLVVNDQLIASAQNDYDAASVIYYEKDAYVNILTADLDTARLDLQNAYDGKRASEDALSVGNPYTLSTYQYSQDAITLTQYDYIDEQFNSYSPALWYKPADTLVQISDGAATLKGTGANYNAAFYSNRYFARSDNLIFKSNFKVSSTSGRFIAALDGATSMGALRRFGILVQSGIIYAQKTSGTFLGPSRTFISTAKANTDYTVEFQTTAQEIKLYIWESSLSKPVNPSYIYKVADWTSARLYYSVYSGMATLDSVSIKTQAIIKEFDTASNLVKETHESGAASLYSYQPDKIIATDYIKFPGLSHSLSTPNLWYKPADTLVQISDGAAILKGTGVNYNAALYSNRYFARSDNLIFKSNFKVSSTSGRFIAALDGSTSAGAFRRFGIVVQNGVIYAQKIPGTLGSGSMTFISIAKANTDYTVEFQTTAQDIKLYVWESSLSKPVNPSYIYKVADWISARPYYSVYSGTATLSAVYINHILNTRTIVPSSPEWPRIWAINQAVKNLESSIYDEISAQKKYDDLSAALSGARSALDAARINKDRSLEDLNSLKNAVSLFPPDNDALAGAGIFSATYDSGRNVKELEKINGDMVRYQDGLPSDIIVDGAQIAAFQYTIGQSGNIANIETLRDGMKRIYNKYGSLSSLTLQDNTKIIYENNEVAQIQRPVSTNSAASATIKNFIYDEAGNVTGYEATETDGSVAAYINGKIVGRTGPDGSKIKYVEGKIDTVESVDGKIYKYTYDAAGIRKDLIQYKLDDGSILRLKDGNIESALLVNGARLTNLVFDDLNNLKSADIALPGGGYGLIAGGELKKAVLSDGTEIEYENGYIKYAVKTDGSRLDYSYSLDAFGNILEFVVKDAGKETIYGQDFLVKKALSGGYTVDYENGKIKAIASENADYIISDPVFDENFKLSEAKVILSDGNICEFRNGRKEAIVRPNGARISFDEKGDVVRVEQNGIIENYIYARNQYGVVLSISVDHNRKGVFKIEDIISYLKEYDSIFEEEVSDRQVVNLLDNPSYYINGYANSNYGTIGVFDRRNDETLQDPAIKYEIQYTTLPINGSNLYWQPYAQGALTFGPNNYSSKLISIEIKETENSSGIPISIGCGYAVFNSATINSDINKLNEWNRYLFYRNENTADLKVLNISIQPVKNIQKEGAFYISDISIAQLKTLNDFKSWEGALKIEPNNAAEFSKVPAELTGANYAVGNKLFASLNINEFVGSTPLYSIYDLNDNLKQIKRSDGSIINFSSSKPENMIEPDEKVIDYDYDGLSIKRASIFPENNLAAPDVVVEYEFNRIKKATRGNVTYSYAYETAANGSEIVIIKNESTNYTHRYSKGALLSVVSGDGIMTEYSYGGSQINKAFISFNGKPQETFTYDYAGDLITVTNEQGVRRTYDKNNRLIFLETAEGLGYVYTYAEDDSGKDMLEAELYQSKGKDGIIIYHKDGKIDSIRLKDGTVVKVEDSFNQGGLQNMTINDGLVESVVYETGETAFYLRDEYGRLNSVRVEKNGVTRWYNPNGELIKIQKTPGEYYLYGYTRKENGGIDKVKVSKVTMASVGGGMSPVKIYAYSAGYRDGVDAGIFISDRGYSSSNTNWWWQRQGETFIGRGHDVVVVDDITGKVLKAGLFDVWGGGEAESNRLADFINSTEAGDYVIDAVADEGTWHLNEAAKKAIESIGSALIRNVKDRESWAIIGRKGSAKGAAIEKKSAQLEGPVFISNYNLEHAYYDESGNPVAFDDFYNTVSATWFSIRPTHVTDEIEIFSTNSDVYASGFIKNYNAQYPDSGFVRLWDLENDVYSDAKMQELASLVDGKKEKALYYDPRYPTSWTTRDYALKMKSYFANLGYAVLDADQLRQWMKTKGPDSAVLMCQDMAPSTIISRYTADCAARDYLDNGGTYVWIHDVPFYYIGYADGTNYIMGEIGQKKALGVITPVTPRVTSTGYDSVDKYKDIMENCVIPEYAVSEDQEPLDKSILTFDFSVNYRDIDWHKIKDEIGYDLKEDTAVVSEYNSDGNLVSVAKADRTVSIYNGDKVDFITDIHGDIMVDYTYDDGGKLIGLNMAQTRRDLEYKISDVKNEIAKDKAVQIEELAIQKGLIIDKIKGWADGERGRLYGIRSQYEGQLSSLEGQNFWWPREKRQKSIAMDQIRSVINQINDGIRQVNDEEARQIALLDGELAGVVRDIDNSAAQAFRDIEVERLKLLDQLSLEEKRPVIFEYYRDIMGRDPDDSEMTYWIDRIKASANKSLDINALKTYLYNSSEYIERLNKVNKIRGEIDGILKAYILKTPEAKEAFLSSLKLTLKDAVTLSEEDIAAILLWLQNQNQHFGRSAANILGGLLADKGISYKPEDLIRDAILVDILTGVINRLSEGELLISAYALGKVASRYNLELTPVKISFEYLAAMFAMPSPKKVVAFLGGNHYVLVTGINTAANEVTYIETSKGPAGGSFTVSINEFKDAWQGNYALTQEKPLDAGAILSDYQAQKVRGACFEWLFVAIAAIFSSFVIPVIQGIVVVIGAIIGQIVVPAVIAAFNLLVNFVGGLVYGVSLLGKALFVGLKFAGLSLFKGFASFFAGNLFGGSVSAATIPSAIASSAVKTVVGIAVNFGINAGLDALGVNPTITRCISAFVTGGLVGAIGNPAVGFFHFADAMGALAVEGVNYFGSQLNLPGPIIDAFSIAAGSLTGGLFTVGTDIPNLVSKVAVNLASEMAYIGVTKAGELLGVDPRISYLAGVGIRSTLNAGLTHDFKPDVIWGSITQGLLQGVTNIGLNFATEELGISPLLANIGFSAISGAINAGIQAATGGSHDVFGALFKTYTDNALTFLGSGDPSNAWQQAAYISQILDFSDIVQERGLVDALNTYGAGFFNAVAVNQIVQSGMSIGQYFATKLAAGQYTTRTLQDGTVVKEVAVTDGQNTTANAFFQQKQVGESTYWDLIGGEEFRGGDSYLGWGNFGVDPYGKLGYTDAKLYSIFDSDIQYQQVIGGQQAYAEIKDLQGNTLLIIEPTEGGSYNVYDSYGEYVDAKVASYTQPLTINLKDGFVAYSNSLFSSNFLYDGDIQRLSEYGFTIEDLYGAQLSLTASSDGTISRTLYWSSREQAENVWTKTSQPGIWANVQERFDNSSQWLGFRTNTEIQQHLLNEYQKMSTMGQTGDIIFVNGRGFLANSTKNVTRGPTNHTAMIYVDSNGEKWALEMLADTGLQKIKLTEFMTRMVAEGNDIQIGRRNNIDVGTMATTIRQELFSPGTEDAKRIPYNSFNIFGLNERSEKSFICSGMIKYVYQKANRPIFVNDQFQYSPVDIYNEIDKIGTKY